MIKLQKPACLEETIFLKIKTFRYSLRNTCLNCKGTGVVSFDEENKIVHRCKSCSGKFESYRKYLDVNISPRHVEFTLEKVAENIEPRCLEAFKKIIENDVKFISVGHIFISQKSETTSFGVSTLGTILLKDLVDKGYDCCVVSAQELCDCFFNFSDDKTRNEKLSKLIDYYESVHVLMITDFSDQFKAKSNSTFAVDKLIEFIMKRKVNGRYCIFCSSIHWSKFDELYKKNKLGDLILESGFKFEIVTALNKNRENASQKLASELNILSDYTAPTKVEKKVEIEPNVEEKKEQPTPEKKVVNHIFKDPIQRVKATPKKIMRK